jgi:hypothetical protein
MNTKLAQEAQINLNLFKSYCTKEEFKKLSDTIADFDILLTGVGFNAIQAKQKLYFISKLSFSEFLGVMFCYFGKTLKELQNV